MKKIIGEKFSFSGERMLIIKLFGIYIVMKIFVPIPFFS
jgi:hypothetical protein